MTTALANIAPANTRRWPRYHASLPVLIASKSKKPVPGLACEISQGGMALYGGVDFHPGDLMEVEFQTSGKLRMAGVVRNRSGFCFGLEFLDLMANTQAFAELVQPKRSATAKKSWIAKHRGDFSFAIAVALLLLALAAPDSPSPITQANASAVPSLTLFERAMVGLGLAETPAAAPTFTGNPDAQVWVDVHTALYYCSGSELFGKTPGGKITTQRDAQQDQFEPAARKSCE